MPILGIIASSIIKIFTDNFNRTTSGSLGTSSSGGIWESIRGTWFANGSQAQTNDSAGNYPIAVYDMGTNAPTVDLDVSTSNGTGVAFWVSDSSNWYGVYPFQDTTITYSSFCSAYGSTCSAYTYTQVCVAYTLVYIRGRARAACTAYSSSKSCSAYTTVCTAYGQSSSANPGQRYLRLTRSVGGSISTLVDQAVSAAVASIKVIVNAAGQITARAYSSPGQISQTGSDLVNTPSSPIKGTKHGLILGPGGYTTGNTSDNITISLTP